MDKKKVKELMEQIDFIAHDFIDGDKQEELQNLVSEVQGELNKSDWVSVEDGLPELEEDVLVCNKQAPYDVEFSRRTEHDWLCVDRNGFIEPLNKYPITHWKPIEKLEE